MGHKAAAPQPSAEPDHLRHERLGDVHVHDGPSRHTQHAKQQSRGNRDMAYLTGSQPANGKVALPLDARATS